MKQLPMRLCALGLSAALVAGSLGLTLRVCAADQTQGAADETAQEPAQQTTQTEKESTVTAAAQAGKKSGVVIACGGGTPLFEENRRALSQNGRLILLERDRNLLPTDGRPLSIDLEALEKARMPVYLAAADDRVENNLSARYTAKKIWEAHKA